LASFGLVWQILAICCPFYPSVWLFYGGTGSG